MTAQLRAIPFLLTLIAMLAGLTADTGAHEFPEQKRVLISVQHDSIEILIAHEIRPGSTAQMLNAAADANRNGRIDLDSERLGASQAILPRMLTGLVFWIDGQPVQPSLERIDVQLGAYSSQGAGLVGLGGFRVPLPESPVCFHEIALSVIDTEHHVALEFQVKNGVRMVESSAPVQDGDVVTNIRSMHSGEREFIRVYMCEGPELAH